MHLNQEWTVISFTRCLRLPVPIAVAVLTAICVLIFAAGGAAQTFEVLHTFPTPKPVRPYAPLIQATDGNFYGTATRGGINDAGAVFRMTPAGTVTFLHEFDAGATDGGYPYGGLVEGPGKILYGTTSEGGATNAGIIYKMTLDGVFTMMRSLTSAADGANPQGALIFVGADLYGTTSTGALGHGTVFKVTTAGAFTVIHSFTGGTAGGSHSNAPLIQGADGFLYGTTSNGGTSSLGTVFKMTLSGAFTLLHSFVGGADGQDPQAALLQGSDGQLYGTTAFGGTAGLGTAFRTTTTGTLAILHSFQGAADGREPRAALIEMSNGVFWGTTRYQGSGAVYYGGRLFQITSAGTVTSVHEFTIADGGMPYGAPVRANDGFFYGTTSRGGDAVANGAGTTYKITAAGAHTKLYSFDTGPDGARPHSPLVRGTDGNLYGTAQLGGGAGWGVIFRITPGGIITTLHSLDGVTDSQFVQSSPVQAMDGDFYGGIQPVLYKMTLSGTFTILNYLDPVPPQPEGDGINTLMQHTDGNFYGTANLFGIANKGTAFKSTTTGAVTLLHTFTGGAADGDTPSPFTRLVQGADGNLYGTTEAGGTSNDGVIYKLSPSGTFTLLHSFNSATEGRSPQAPLLLASDGNFYGTTSIGGPGTGGTIFKMTPAGAVTIVHQFSGALTNGAYSYAGLVQAPNGIMYGTTSSGGASNQGTVYNLTLAGAFGIVHSFAGGAGGAAPGATPTLAPGGHLYGTTFYGGVPGPGMGVVYHMKVSASQPFTDDPLIVGGTGIKAVHVTELRARIDALRIQNGLTAFSSYTDPVLTAGSTRIRAQHITELRTALAQVYSKLGLTPPTYATDPNLGVGTNIRAAHIAELRTNVIAIE